MGIDYDAFWLDHSLLYGTYKYYEPQWPNYYPDAFLLDHDFVMTDDNGAHRLEWPPIIIIPPTFYEGFFLNKSFYMTDGDIHRLEYIPIVIPIPVFYSGFMFDHWTRPTVSPDGDTAYWLIRYRTYIVDFGASAHHTFVNRRVTFYNRSDGVEFLWDFGDGGGSTSKVGHHTYCKAGVYTVKLYIDGVWYTDDMQVVVLENNFIMDAGAVYINYGEKGVMRLGATEGGNLFGIEQEVRYMTFDGAKGAQLTGAHRVIGSTPKIIANMIEIDYQLLNRILPACNLSFSSGSVNIQRAIRKLLENDYVKNIALVAQHGPTGAFIIFKILNAVTLESIEIPFEDSNESVIECTFSGCFSADNLDYEPWEIEFIQ